MSTKKTKSSETIQWVIDESAATKRGVRWHIGAAGIGMVLMLWAVVTVNFLFAVIVLLIGLSIFLESARGTKELPVTLTTEGIHVSETLYRYKDIRDFWIITDPDGIHTLFLRFTSSLKPRLPLEIRQYDPEHVRAFIGQFVPEDVTEETESFSDALGKILKL